jgi:Na+/H+ antiporter NhaD/arsenite permease-like protein
LVLEHAALVKAVSIGSVFFGALTYIGNGPNLMVKQLAERERVKVPSFLGYVLRFALPILLPIYCWIGWLAFRS